MKQFSIFAILTLIMMACDSEKDANISIDPRDAFVGTYYISAEEACSDCLGNVLTNSYNNTIAVTKGDRENELKFTDNYQTNHRVTLNGSEFTIVQFNISSGGYASGSGSFGTNSMIFSLNKQFPAQCANCYETGHGTRW